MPNYLLCDQFHVRISGLAHACTVSSNAKGNLGSSRNAKGELDSKVSGI